jgi:hypothetical protein
MLLEIVHHRLDAIGWLRKDDEELLGEKAFALLMPMISGALTAVSDMIVLLSRWWLSRASYLLKALC